MHKNKGIVAKTLVCISILVSSINLTISKKPPKHIAITQIAPVEALDKVRSGIEDQLKADGFEDLKISFLNAQGNITTSAQIAEKLCGESPDAIIGISTPSALACIKASNNKIPVIFGAVTDPKSSGLLRKDSEVTGVSDYVPVEKNLDLMKDILRSVKTVGVVFNAGESNSVATIDRLRKACKERHIELIEAAINKTSDIQSAVESIIAKGEISAFLVTTDNTVVSAYATLSKILKEKKIPAFVSDNGSLELGGLAAVSVDYYKHGRQVGKLVSRNLDGEKASKIPYQEPENVTVYINEKVANELGIKIPKEIIEKSTVIK